MVIYHCIHLPHVWQQYYSLLVIPQWSLYFVGDSEVQNLVYSLNIPRTYKNCVLNPKGLAASKYEKHFSLSEWTLQWKQSLDFMEWCCFMNAAVLHSIWSGDGAMFSEPHMFIIPPQDLVVPGPQSHNVQTGLLSTHSSTTLYMNEYTLYTVVFVNSGMWIVWRLGGIMIRWGNYMSVRVRSTRDCNNPGRGQQCWGRGYCPMLSACNHQFSVEYSPSTAYYCYGGSAHQLVRRREQ